MTHSRRLDGADVRVCVETVSCLEPETLTGGERSVCVEAKYESFPGS